MKRTDNILFDSQQKKFFANFGGELIEVGGNGTGVTSVASLPATGEEGKIYYNTTDNKYYVYNTDTGFKTLGGSDVLIDDVNINPKIGSVLGLDSGKYILFPGTMGFDIVPGQKVVVVDDAIYVGTAADITEEEFNYIDTPFTWEEYSSDDWQYGDLYVVTLDDIADVDTNAVHYTSWCRTWWKFERITNSVEEDSLGVVVINTSTTYKRPMIEQSGQLDVATINLNPSEVNNSGSIDTLVLNDDNGIGSSPFYIIPITGRFTASRDNVQIVLPVGIESVDNNPEIESGHVYEYSILMNKFSIIDVNHAFDGGGFIIGG